DFQTRSFDSLGRSTAELSGAGMEHIPGNQTVRVAEPRLRVVDADGARTLASAEVGLSNADASNVQLFGQAVVRRLAPNTQELTVRSSFLNIFPQERRISSNRPSTVQQGSSLFSGNDLQMNGLDGTFTMQGSVRGTLRPSPG
ncbi:MAG: LPS export ABC transporter periplasmic protein LptC, partial [Betaproteobacteria bacterium]|nr:LPS export ABC transporter periplasmic protein LptC [Betaproteobacteria bacterium]